MSQIFSKYILTTLLICLFYPAISKAQSEDSYFWKGVFSNKEINGDLFFSINDSLFKYNLSESKYTFTGQSINNSSQVKEIITDSLNRLLFVYKDSLKLYDVNLKKWSKINTPLSSYIKIGKLYGNNFYFTNGYKIYRTNITNDLSSWEIVCKVEDLDRGNPMITNTGDTFFLNQPIVIEDFALTKSGTLFVSEYWFTIYKTSDFGKTWSKTTWTYQNREDTYYKRPELNIPSSTPGHLYTINNRLYVGTWWDGIFFSDDNGLNFTKSKFNIKGTYLESLNAFLQRDFIQGGPSGISRIESNGKGTVFAFLEDQQSSKGYYYSTDNGINFNKLNTPLNIWEEQFLKQIIQIDSNFILNADYRGFLKTTDAGKSWVELNNNIENNKPHHVKKILINSKGEYYALLSIRTGTGGYPKSSWGILYSKDKGKKWTNVASNLFDLYFTIEDMILNAKDELLVSVYSPGFIYKYNPITKVWIKSDVTYSNKQDRKFTIDKFNLNYKISDTIFATTYFDGIINSYDGGQTWQGVNYFTGTTGIAVFKNDDTVYVQTGDSPLQEYKGISNFGSFKSINGGRTWTRVNTFISNKVGNTSIHLINNSVSISDNEGQSFTPIKSIPVLNTSSLYTYSFGVKLNSYKNKEVDYDIVYSTNFGTFLKNVNSNDWLTISDKGYETFAYDTTISTILLYSTSNRVETVLFPKIIASDSICNNDTIILKTNTNSSVSWTLYPTNKAVIKNNNILKADSSGQITVILSYKNNSGNTINTYKQIYIKPSPIFPIISRNPNGRLVSSVNTGNQWYYNDLLMQDSINNFIVPNKVGSYKVNVKNNGCYSLFSSTYFFIITDVALLKNEEYVKLGPNPFNSQLYIDYSVRNNQNLNIEFFNLVTGSKYKLIKNITKGSSIDVSTFAAGTYLIKVYTNDYKLLYQSKFLKF